jgi:hypothetical protein
MQVKADRPDAQGELDLLARFWSSSALHWLEGLQFRSASATMR